MTLAECGHVPQVELPDRTNLLIRAHVKANPARPHAYALARTA